MELRWRLQARDKQRTPPGDWLIWLIKSGRGFGKTRTGAEDTAHFARRHPLCRQAIVAPTFAMGRDICVEGESGLLTVLAPEEIAYWNRSEGQLILKNGARWKIFSSTQPERLRGYQAHRAWCEEMGSWAYTQETWDMLMFGLRLGEHPQVVITTTPKPYKLLKDIIGRPTAHVTSGSTFENAANLSAVALDEMRRRYDGTYLGLQELYGEIIEDVEGALWRRSMIEETRAPLEAALYTFERIAISIDVATTSNSDSDETGIIVAGRKGLDGYVIDDLSMKASPEVWAAAAIHAYSEWQADAIVYETNQGGELIASTLKAAAAAQGIAPSRLNMVPVHASRGKRTRAEPISTMYAEQGGHRIHHIRAFPELEDQMCTWVPGEDSPDRMDSLVWNLTYLMEDALPGRRKLRYTQ